MIWCNVICNGCGVVNDEHNHKYLVFLNAKLIHLYLFLITVHNASIKNESNCNKCATKYSISRGGAHLKTPSYFDSRPQDNKTMSQMSQCYKQYQ